MYLKGHFLIVYLINFMLSSSRYSYIRGLLFTPTLALLFLISFYQYSPASVTTLSPKNPQAVSYAYKVEYFEPSTRHFGSTLNMYLSKKPTSDFVLSFKLPDSDIIDYYGDWELRTSPTSKRNYLKKGNLMDLVDASNSESKFPMQFKFYFNALSKNTSIQDPNELVLTDYALLETDNSSEALDLIKGEDYQNIEDNKVKPAPFGIFKSGLGTTNPNSVENAHTKSMFTMIKEYGQDSDGTKFIEFPVGLVVFVVIFVIGASFYLWGTITRLKMRSKYQSSNGM